MSEGYDRPSGRIRSCLVNIREMNSNDLEAALVLNNASVPELNELDAFELSRLAGLSAVSLVAEVDGSFAGFCVVLAPGIDYISLNYQWFTRNYDEFVYLDRIAVHPEFRRYGIGRTFYSTLVERFHATAPVLLCEVNVRPRNDASLAFHSSIGFREVGRQDTDGGTKTVSLLELALSAHHVR